eukprot:jgi/Mesen1/5137/ME000255S04104
MDHFEVSNRVAPAGSDYSLYRGIQTVLEGRRGSLSFRVHFQDTTSGQRVSPWHSVPLYAGHDMLNFVCEIPQDTRAKYEVSTKEVGNPIKLDSKNDKPRYYGIDMPWNYGMLPQTWEDPAYANAECGGSKGDDDPVDVVEISGRQCAIGDIFPVKPVAAFAMIDEGELDWKVIAIAADDPRCQLVNSVADLEIHVPGVVGAIREWFRTYKTFDGKPENGFELGERAMEPEYVMTNVIAHTHAFWKAFVRGNFGAEEDEQDEEVSQPAAAGVAAAGVPDMTPFTVASEYPMEAGLTLSKQKTLTSEAVKEALNYAMVELGLEYQMPLASRSRVSSSAGIRALRRSSQQEAVAPPVQLNA